MHCLEYCGLSLPVILTCFYWHNKVLFYFWWIQYHNDERQCLLLYTFGELRQSHLPPILVIVIVLFWCTRLWSLYQIFISSVNVFSTCLGSLQVRWDIMLRTYCSDKYVYVVFECIYRGSWYSCLWKVIPVVSNSYTIKSLPNIQIESLFEKSQMVSPSYLSTVLSQQIVLYIINRMHVSKGLHKVPVQPSVNQTREFKSLQKFFITQVLYTRD